MTQLTPIADDLWAAEHDLTMMGIHFRGRMTVVRLADGRLLLHSPVPIDDELAAELEALGPVGFLVAPSLFHHVHVAGVMERYPDAKLYGAPGFEKKRKDLRFDGVLGDAPDDAWQADLDQVAVQGAPITNEVVFLHRPTRTLIVTDLVFNVHEHGNWLTKAVYWMAGTLRKFGQSRSWRMFVKDRAAASASARRVLDLDFDRVVMAHGEIVETGGRALLDEALAWMLSA